MHTILTPEIKRGCHQGHSHPWHDTLTPSELTVAHMALHRRQISHPWHAKDMTLTPARRNVAHMALHRRQISHPWHAKDMTLTPVRRNVAHMALHRRQISRSPLNVTSPLWRDKSTMLNSHTSECNVASMVRQRRDADTHL